MIVRTYKYTCLAVSICIYLLMVLSPVIASGEENKLNILYTGSVSGELEPCGCTRKSESGGVARRAGYIDGHANELSPFVLIDAGNFTDKDTPQGRLKAEAMLKAFSLMQYDAVAFMNNEKDFSPGFLDPLVKKLSVPVVAKGPLFRKSLSIREKGIDINITADERDYQEGRLNILLTDRSLSGLVSLKGWDVIILSSGEILDKPVKINGSVVVSGYPEGKKLGILTLQINNKGKVSGFEHRWQTLDKDIMEDKDVRKVLKEYDMMVARLSDNKKPPAGKTSYAGVTECGKCHQPFVKTWQRTRHANAFLSLKRRGKSSDPECLKCHTVGFGEKGGFYSIATTPGLANVQCEVCHGQGRDHVSDYSTPLQPVTEKTCKKCHTKSNSPDFNYPVYLEKIRHE
ncbi:cytochrome c-554 precursor [bacterium BMS3Bbin06]|nr:cytochrome c-554 precursor [bacterium BMS3Abin07]GBE02392.1 cytochrome c-554 precursor [bacterium BMS3Abin08]GBE34467.1 cytochrome c-554 precursor [bacterium BMS3Bbin06]